MEIPNSVRTTLAKLMSTPSLDLARQLEQQLAGLGQRREVFGGRINQKASIEAASEGDRGVVERLTNAFDAALTASKVMSGAGTSDSALTPRRAAQRFLNPDPDSCDWKPQYPKIDFKMPIVQFWREDETKRRFKRYSNAIFNMPSLYLSTNLPVNRW